MGKAFPPAIRAFVENLATVKEKRLETDEERAQNVGGLQTLLIGINYEFDGKLIANDEAGR